MEEHLGRQKIYKWLVGGGLITLVTVAVIASSLLFSGRQAQTQQGGTQQQTGVQPGSPQNGAAGQAQVVAGSPSSQVHVTWFDSVALVQWQPTQGAKGYRITLIRLRDGGIEQQADVPATQTAFDAQGVWPNEQYQVVIQPLDSKSKPGTALYSQVGHAAPINRSQYNGFLDTMNIDEGPIDGSLWDERGYYGGATQSSFINNQIHGHIETGQIADEQSLVGISPRVPFDFTNRMGTIHGEVDLHGNTSNWFGAVLAPRHIMPTEFVDTGDRNDLDFSLPMLEVFNDNNGVTLFETAVGSHPYELGTYKPRFDDVNVRHTIDWMISTTHVELLVDGQVIINRALPVRLPFSVGYLTLVAESYPKQSDVLLGHLPACDQVGGECNTWHLDNWGFDAPSKSAVMPATGVASDALCPLKPTDELKPAYDCNEQRLSTSPVTYKVSVTDASPMRSAALLVDVNTYASRAPQVRISVNGGPWTGSLYPASAYGALYTFPINASLLHQGTNTVQVKLATGASDDVMASNMVIDQVFRRVYTAPALPTERSPLGSWKFGSSPHALINANALAAVTCSSQQPGGSTTVTGCCGCCDCMDDRSTARRNAPIASA
jgi:hypothetical protein